MSKKWTWLSGSPKKRVAPKDSLRRINPLILRIYKAVFLLKTPVCKAWIALIVSPLLSDETSRATSAYFKASSSETAIFPEVW